MSLEATQDRFYDALMELNDLDTWRGKVFDELKALCQNAESCRHPSWRTAVLVYRCHDCTAEWHEYVYNFENFILENPDTPEARLRSQLAEYDASREAVFRRLDGIYDELEVCTHPRKILYRIVEYCDECGQEIHRVVKHSLIKGTQMRANALDDPPAPAG